MLRPGVGLIPTWADPLVVFFLRYSPTLRWMPGIQWRNLSLNLPNAINGIIYLSINLFQALPAIFIHRKFNT